MLLPCTLGQISSWSQVLLCNKIFMVPLIKNSKEIFEIPKKKIVKAIYVLQEIICPIVFCYSFNINKDNHPNDWAAVLNLTYFMCFWCVFVCFAGWGVHFEMDGVEAQKTFIDCIVLKIMVSCQSYVDCIWAANKVQHHLVTCHLLLQWCRGVQHFALLHWLSSYTKSNLGQASEQKRKYW